MSFEQKDGAADAGQRRPHLPSRSGAPSAIWKAVRLLLVLVVGGAACVVVARWLRDGDDGTTATRPGRSNEPTIVAEGVTHSVIWDKGRRVWEFSARRIVITPDRQYAIATGMEQATFFRDNKPYLKLKAGFVRLNQQTFNAEASGGVVADGPEGVRIRTERANWSHMRRVRSCPATVEASVRGLTVQSRNVSYDMPQSRLHCPQTIEVQGSQVTLRGKRATVDVKSRQVEFDGGTEVVLQQPFR
jgi:hypothetical protein